MSAADYSWGTTLPGYFIDTDALNDLWLWRRNGDFPRPIVSQHELRDDPAVWALLVAATGGAA